MATKQTLISNHVDSPAIRSLTEEYGDRLAVLGASEKLNLLVFLTHWQEMDTQAQEEGCEETPLSEYLEGADCISEPISEDVARILELLGNVDDESALKLIITIVHQLLEGVYLQ